VSLNFYRRAGFLPEALLNYLALMGWAMPDEHEEFSVDEFVHEFTLERISLGGPVFDVEKLKWLNGKYLRRLSPAELLERLRAQLLSEGHLREVIPLVQERIDTLEGFFEYASFFFTGEVAYDADATRAMVPKGRTPADNQTLLKLLVEEELDLVLDWRKETLETAIRRFSEKSGWPAGELFMTLRVATTGRVASPPLFETLAVLGKETCRRRLRRAAEFLKTGVASE
jgi:glutamyl-tRNA synthetase